RHRLRTFLHGWRLGIGPPRRSRRRVPAGSHPGERAVWRAKRFSDRSGSDGSGEGHCAIDLHDGNSGMLIARAPLRVSLAGGGTDLEAYYSKYGGAVVSVTIDKYFYVFISPSDSQHIQVSSSDYQTFYRQRFDEEPLWDGDLRLPKAIINHFGIHTGLSVFLASQVPPGTGLGSSSTVAVALIKAMSVLCGHRLTTQQIAELACEIEIEQLKMPIGKQDQYAAAFGGLNFFEFRQEAVVVQPIELEPDVQTELERRLMLFFTGRSRNSA